MTDPNQTEPVVTQAAQDAANALWAEHGPWKLGTINAVTQAFARFEAEVRTAAEAASRTRLTAALEMAEDYHAAHIAERDRAQRAEADLAASRAEVKRLRWIVAGFTTIAETGVPRRADRVAQWDALVAEARAALTASEAPDA